MEDSETDLEYCEQAQCGYYKEPTFQVCRFHKCVVPTCPHLMRDSNFCEGHALALSYIKSQKEWWMEIPLDPGLPWGKNMKDYIEMQNNGMPASWKGTESNGPIQSVPESSKQYSRWGFQYTSPFGDDNVDVGDADVEEVDASVPEDEQEAAASTLVSMQATPSPNDPLWDGVVMPAEPEDQASDYGERHEDEMGVDDPDQQSWRHEGMLSGKGPMKRKGTYDMGPPPTPRGRKQGT